MTRIKINPSILNSSVMIVDDSAISRRKLGIDLTHRGFTNISEATSGIECLEMLKTANPDLFLLDMLMPGMNGNELVKHIRNMPEHRETPIIIVTVSDEEELIKECFSLGANDFLRKPWDADELSTRVVSQIERQQEIKFLRDDKIRLSRALEVMTDGIWECNMKDNKMTLSPSCYRILNITEDTLIDTNYIISIIHPDDLKRMDTLLQKAIKANKTTLDFECRIQLDSDTSRWISTKAKVTEYDSNGFPECIVGVSRDITSQVIAQKHLQKFGKEMRELAEERSQIIIHNERLAALGTMSAGIAHEISNPLSYIKGNIQLLIKTIPTIIQNATDKAVSDDTRQELCNGLESIDSVLSSLEDGIKRVSDISSTMKNFSSNRADKTEENDIARAIDDALLLCHNYTKRGIKIIKDYQTGVHLIPFNLQQITQVLINLIINAAHAMKYCGTITIRTRIINGELMLQLEDTGPGIPDELKDSIFNAFYTTKKADEGTGLGLYISKSIISEHNGRIAVENSPKNGTIFSIYLPADSNRDKTGDDSEHNHRITASSKNLQIIIAEDDMLIQEIIIQKLNAFTCDTIVKTTIEDTVAAVETLKPDAIILSMTITTPNSIIEIMEQLSKKELFPPVFIIEAEHYVKFPLEQLKQIVDISKFESIDIVDSKELSNIFN